MPEDLHFLALWTIPIILVAVWAVYMFTRRKVKPHDHNAREDRTEPAELRGPEQHKRRATR